MKREVTYNVEAVVRTGEFESVRFFYGERAEGLDAEGRLRMMRRVKATVERDVLELRAELAKRRR